MSRDLDRRSAALLVICAVGLGAWLRIRGLAYMPLYGDEYHGIRAARFDFAVVFRNFDSYGTHIMLPLLQRITVLLLEPSILNGGRPGVGRVRERELRVDEGLVGRDEHRDDTLASALGALGGEVQAVDLGRRPDHGEAADVLREQATDRVDLVVVELDAEQVAELIDGHARAHAELVVAQLL